MNLHEYQAKFLLGEFGVPVPLGRMVRTLEEVEAAAQELGGTRWVVKAQVHAGGRGKAGGVKLVSDLAELRTESKRLLGSQLITGQSAPLGLPVNCLLIEQASEIASELYLGLLVDRASKRLSFIGSVAGGMDIEAVAADTPDKIITVAVDPVVGLQAYQCRYMAFALGLLGSQMKQITKIMTDLYRLFLECDASLVEINPLAISREGELIAVDGKINLDSNALYRQKSLLEMRDPSQEDEKEYQASAHGLNYIALDGNIACMVNGAGLAMATMDLIKLHGGEPANFLDVGGGTTPERVAEAFKLILSDAKVKAILVNIFGGIVRCDLIADGIIQAVKEVAMSVPVIVRLEGTNVEQGKAKLKESGLAIIAADDLTDAAKQAVAAAGGAH